MPTLTRRRSTAARTGMLAEPHGDERVGTIARRSGIPRGWTGVFYRGSHLGECTQATPTTLDQARPSFKAAWRMFLSKRTETDFQARRDQQEWTERKYAMWEWGEKPIQKPSSLMTCPCGQIFDSHQLEQMLLHVPHVTAVQGRNKPGGSQRLGQKNTVWDTLRGPFSGVRTGVCR